MRWQVNTLMSNGTLMAMAVVCSMWSVWIALRDDGFWRVYWLHHGWWVEPVCAMLIYCAMRRRAPLPGVPSALIGTVYAFRESMWHYYYSDAWVSYVECSARFCGVVVLMVSTATILNVANATAGVEKECTTK